jgi:hypothetical protein
MFFFLSSLCIAFPPSPKWTAEGEKKEKVVRVRVVWNTFGNWWGGSFGHSQLATFTTPPASVLENLLLLSNSSRREANKRCVRSALGCRCSISVTQDDGANWRVVKKRVKSCIPLCNTLSTVLPTSSGPSVRHLVPFEPVGSAKSRTKKKKRGKFVIDHGGNVENKNVPLLRASQPSASHLPRAAFALLFAHGKARLRAPWTGSRIRNDVPGIRTVGGCP